MKLFKLAILALVLTACEKDLDLKYHYIDPLTVIEAQLTPEGCRVGITLTTPMDEPMDLTRLTDAAVTVSDLTSGAEYALMPDDDGFYVDPTPGIVGHDYRLTVSRGGQTFFSETTMLPPSEIIGLQFNWINMPYDQVAVLQGQFLENPDFLGDCYWVQVYRNGKIYMWNQIDDRNAVNGIGTFFTMTTRRDTSEEDDSSVILDGDVVTMVLIPIHRTIHDYLEALQNDSSGPILFSGEKCLGYFIATSPTSASITFHPDDIPLYE